MALHLLPAFYPFLKTAHIVSATLSVLGVLVSFGLQRSGGRSLFRTSYSRLVHFNDVVLLSLGISLIWVLSLDVLATPWLQVKLALVVVYILLVMAALSERRSRRARNIVFALALTAIAGIVSLAYYKPVLAL